MNLGVAPAWHRAHFRRDKPGGSLTDRRPRPLTYPLGATIAQHETPPPPQRSGFIWAVLGIFDLMIASCVLLNTAANSLPLWWFSDQYVAAELEVTRLRLYRGRTNSVTAPFDRAIIEGVIHPGGARVETNGGDIAIERFVDPADGTGRRLPVPRELEGRRLAVCFWPGYDDVRSSWKPPAVVMPAAVARAGVSLARIVLIGGAFVAFGVWCLRRVGRLIKLAAPRV